MRRYRYHLNQFISAQEIDEQFRELAKKKFDELIIDFSNLQTVDRLSFEALLKMSKSFELMGREVYFCCIPPYIADILSNWDFNFKVLFDVS